MEKTNNILLNSSVNKKSANENSLLNVSLRGNRILLPEEPINDVIDLYDLYLNEREQSNKFRLIVNIKPFCSNVLFNPITEIVKNEGSKDVICLNYKTDYKEPNSIGKSNDFKWTQYEAIRDTQISNDVCGFDYHCGIDIFNNHILRNKSFKSVNFNEDNSSTPMVNYSCYGYNYKNIKVHEGDTPHVYISDDFNTIDDYMRDKNGYVVSDSFQKAYARNISGSIYKFFKLPLHLYQKYDIMSFNECISNNLIESNGWYGFKNPSIISSLVLKNKNDAINKKVIEINKTINNHQAGDFIDMYPGRDLYSFTPKYNKYRNRLEKNWNYCLTYPYSSVTKNGEDPFPFFETDSSGNTSLKVYMFDEGTVDDNGVKLLTIYTICQHGLSVGDSINIYKTYENGDTDLSYNAVEVVNVVDKYIFQVYKDTLDLSNEWVEVENRGSGIYVVGKGDNKKVYPICESNRCNIDQDAQNIHFRKVVNGVECKYYVRKFARIPNFKFKKEEINDYTLYGSNSNNLIKSYSGDFESHIAKMGFADTAYGDDTSEIVFTDDIDISYLRDNLGRPLSDVYLTIVKNNKGYKEWYGIDIEDWKPKNISADTVEYSHCFGKVNGSFVLSDYFREMYNGDEVKEIKLHDVRDLTTTQQVHGLITTNQGNDEIDFYTDWDYYGDLCCYSPIDCNEQVIQTSMHRFNTVQRELPENAKSYPIFSTSGVSYDEIKYDENTVQCDIFNKCDVYDFFKTNHSEVKNVLGVTNQKEGYYYQPHYRISFKTVSSELKKDNAIRFEIVGFKKIGEEVGNTFDIRTSNENNFLTNTKIILYQFSKNKFYYLTVKDVISFTRFTCSIENENGTPVTDFTEFDINDFVLLLKNESVPYYAKLLKDGSCRFYWREILPNGKESSNNVYPFTNGAFYVMRQINFFLRRQDPKKENLGEFNILHYTPDGEDINNYPNFVTDDKYNYEENEFESC